MAARWRSGFGVWSIDAGSASRRLRPWLFVDADSARSWQRVYQRPMAVGGCISLGPPGQAEDACVDASYHGGVNPDSAMDAGIGVKETPFTLPSVVMHGDVDGGRQLLMASVWLILKQAPLWWWWLPLLVVWVVSGVVMDGSGSPLSLAVGMPRSTPGDLVSSHLSWKPHGRTGELPSKSFELCP